MPTNGEPIVRVQNLHKWFGLLHVLRGISLEIYPREVVVIIGRSGSGKSTFLRCLNLLEEPTSGRVEIDGVVVEAADGELLPESRARIRDLRLKTGMVFQEFNVFPHKTALENIIEAPMVVKGVPKNRLWRKAGNSCARWGSWISRTFTPSASPAGRSSELPSPARWRWSRR
jgi:ABC-type polar amino acid transport system ATPase subunit